MTVSTIKIAISNTAKAPVTIRSINLMITPYTGGARSSRSTNDASAERSIRRPGPSPASVVKRRDQDCNVVPGMEDGARPANYADAVGFQCRAAKSAE